ncbi:MAG: cyclic pyranopterin monophosphate synthase MoaC [Albidovulum sp.]|nr:cyclic pyranopterin monophosphate synthase MoaC [Albidovulum sp.]MDE0305353.1 cyclic pyranopterin monophosphate synthase MoaC [Albidovulum sp.]MDE0530946.1 cyclic pyranopterin monophosphate synthase MoaC [Albidovulum sp.]
MNKLSHFDASGKASMVDVSEKPVTKRTAIAKGSVKMAASTLEMIGEGRAGKGDVLAVARIAGIAGAKRTSDLIPLCHPLPLSKVAVEFSLNGNDSTVEIVSTAVSTGRTGVEMEALTAVSVAALTIYDMTKSADRTMEIGEIRLAFKEGGKSGRFVGRQ